MLSPADICKKVEEDLIFKVNTTLERSRVQLYNGETIILHFETQEQQQWAYQQLSHYIVSYSKLVNTCNSHTHSNFCYKSDDDSSDEDPTGTDKVNGDNLYCCHANGSCTCPKYVIFLTMKRNK
jgi:hypothetical protein